MRPPGLLPALSPCEGTFLSGGFHLPVRAQITVNRNAFLEPDSSSCDLHLPAGTAPSPCLTDESALSRSAVEDSEG